MDLTDLAQDRERGRVFREWYETFRFPKMQEILRLAKKL